MAVYGFWALVAVIAVAVVAAIVRAVRLTSASLAEGSPLVDLQNAHAATSLVNQIRARDVPCPQCGQDTFAVLGTGNRYECDSCDVAFEGPAHIPGSPR